MRLKFTDPKGQEQIIDLVALMGANGNALEIDANGSLHTTQVSAAGTAQGFVGDAAKVSIAGASVFDVTWAGAGTTNAPATTNYLAGAVGINNDGATTANVYHIVEVSGVLTWIATGATVANLYGA